ncbi:MAG: hypothetical protein UU81_C0011G0008 [Microgenomates group bacterium GW2011_GWC1_41_8]|uniref:Uncharacterized protein n=3 Tax=Candidatus Roizmaniibacteriota TaxID=1752723 RepID=A0A0G0X316_9BACT|nr:MAG: hypothetical protein UU14_C0027G0024 [Candidatus Roizmanbacteria bacterium GW2011_GWB1_40_7]KKR91365.1 MAG: hypothetical protein UU41_C0039G0006 [Candidatus Roizmanbacteria bacterium GW2011_GWA1_41_13]KKS19380.1 MAG: hypothetical protein UU78_C0086G0007 [Candidatus Roizmanbacteria bacterium GW2011_GWC2_41_7]KKS24186.1 MAG: hypothetical protein UU81_C0011G0008 [Microgenomates group bacterium GW2011_GWC1_41_8]OGK49519.1 MAG: hypothetical protein A3A55_01150 [Candidatus Roizmanbacteria bac
MTNNEFNQSRFRRSTLPDVTPGMLEDLVPNLFSRFDVEGSAQEVRRDLVTKEEESDTTTTGQQ